MKAGTPFLAQSFIRKAISKIGSKIIGASSFEIFKMLFVRFGWVIILSILIASPFANWFIGNWTEEFAFKVPFTLFPYLIGALISLMLVLLTISIQGIKSAISNPVDAIRNS